MADVSNDAELPTLPELLASSSKDTLSPSSLTSPDASSYISRLTALSLQELEAEPTELASSSAQLTNALTTLCYTSYPTFLSLHTTTSTLSSSLDALSNSLSSLLSALPDLESGARTFAQDSRSLLASRRKAALVLEHHDKLHDVLSLPLLLETSVRNHNYSDALLLAQHAATLASRFPSNPLVQSVKADCDARVHSMLAQLLRVLHEQAKLPALFRAVGFLRKMEVLTEQELALAFLAGRSAYLDGSLRAVEVERKGLDGEGSVEREREIHARYLKRYVDAWREGVHDVVTQYTTIFLDRPHGTARAPSELHVLLTTFTTVRVRDLLDLLRETLPLVADPSLLSSLLTQLTYCATSFARVGMDFRAALAPLFVTAVRKGVTREFDDATEAWSKALEAEDTPKYRSRAAGSGRRKPSQLFLSPSAPSLPPIPTPAQLSAIASSPPNVPPPLLASYPPLAVYTNSILSALNGLRLLAPASLLDDLLVALDAALARGAETLLSYARAVANSSSTTSSSSEETKREGEVVRAAASIFLRVLVPYLRRALAEGVYGVKLSDLQGEGEDAMGTELRAALKELEDLHGREEQRLPLTMTSFGQEPNISAQDTPDQPHAMDVEPQEQPGDGGSMSVSREPSFENAINVIYIVDPDDDPMKKDYMDVDSDLEYLGSSPLHDGLQGDAEPEQHSVVRKSERLRYKQPYSECRTVVVATRSHGTEGCTHDQAITISSDEEDEEEDDGHRGPRHPLWVYKVKPKSKAHRKAVPMGVPAEAPCLNKPTSEPVAGPSGRDHGVGRTDASRRPGGCGGLVASKKRRGRPPQAPKQLQDMLEDLRARFPHEPLEIAYRHITKEIIKWGFRCVLCAETPVLGHPQISGAYPRIAYNHIVWHLEGGKHQRQKQASTSSQSASSTKIGSQRAVCSPPDVVDQPSIHRTEGAPTSPSSSTRVPAKPSASNCLRPDTPWAPKKGTGIASGSSDPVEDFLREIGLSLDLAERLRRVGIKDRARMRYLGGMPDGALDKLVDGLVRVGLDDCECLMVRVGLQRYASAADS
ncbi:Dor1-like family-domain-containing protein [Trametes polyzona]|nr:Dor1-like family-domain-containing protein [Trametes polyzona]